MITRLRLSLEDQEEPYKYPTARLFLWLQGAYMDRQLASSFWSFLHTRDSFIVTEANVADYTLPPIKDIDPQSIYYIAPDTNARIPLYLTDYAAWVRDQANGVDLTPSVPLYLIEMPDFSWKVYPTPDRVYRIFADRWIVPSEFAALTAEPIWESEYHEIVLLDAMKIAIALRPESPESLVMAAQIRERLPLMERVFKARYLPAIGSTKAHA